MGLFGKRKAGKELIGEKSEAVEAKLVQQSKKEERVFVIGSKHDFATKSYQWDEPFCNLADCDKLIINLTTLTSEVLLRLHEKENKMKQAKLQISRLLNANGEVFCVMKPSYKLEIEIYNTVWNYIYKCWSPIEFTVTSERGEMITLNEDYIREESIFKEWMSNLEDWAMVINKTASLEYLYEFFRLEEQNEIAKGSIEWKIINIATNRYGGMIAGSAYFSVNNTKKILLEGKTTEEIRSGFIHLLPPPTKISTEDAINNLLSETRKLVSPRIQPEWAKDKKMPGENDLNLKIEQETSKIVESRKEAIKLKNELHDLVFFKDLLFQKGPSLGVAVKKTFERMGLDVSDYEKGKGDEDLILNTPQEKAIIEVKGVDRKSIALSDLRQLAHYVEDSIIDGNPTRGILVGNPYRLLKLEERDIPFPDNVVKFSKKRNLILITSTQLFQVLTDFIKGNIRKEDFLGKLLKSSPLFK